jgi:hypothetical protein
MLSSRVLLAAPAVLGFIWAALFVSELIAWRRGHSIMDEFTEEPPLPTDSKPLKGPGLWLLIAGFFIVLVPAAVVGMVLIMPPLWAVKWISRLTGRHG